MAIKWTKNGQDYVSADGRFVISRYIRRGGIEWGLTDKVVAVEAGVNGAMSTLREAKDAAEWRFVNRPATQEVV